MGNKINKPLTTVILDYFYSDMAANQIVIFFSSKSDWLYLNNKYYLVTDFFPTIYAR